jgi:hypothetical protein
MSHFGGINRLHLQDQRVSDVRIQQKGEGKYNLVPDHSKLVFIALILSNIDKTNLFLLLSKF